MTVSEAQAVCRREGLSAAQVEALTDLMQAVLTDAFTHVTSQIRNLDEFWA